MVADGEDLVEQEHVERHLNRDRVREPQLHPGRVVLQLLVDEPLELCELEDAVEALVEFSPREPEQGRVDPDVVPPRQLGVETDAQLDERRHLAVDAHRAGIRLVDPGDDLQQRALAAAVRADDSEELTRLDREADVGESLLALERPALERVKEVLL